MENRSPFTGDGLAGGGADTTVLQLIGAGTAVEAAEGQKGEGEVQEEENKGKEEEDGGVEAMDIDVPPAKEIAAPAPPTRPTPPPADGTPEPTPQLTPHPSPPPPPPLPPPPPPPLTTPPRGLREVIEAANIANPGRLGADQIVPPSPVVKPGELHEFEPDITDPRARRRSSLNAGIAGLEELRNRAAAEGVDGMDIDRTIHASLEDLVEATNLTRQSSSHVINAFVRLDFDDGQVFYVRNSSVIFGRAEGASSSSFQQIGPDGSTVIGSEPFGGFGPKTTPGAMSMKREKKKRRKKKGVERSATSVVLSLAGSRRGSMVQRQNFPLFREVPYQRQGQPSDDAIPIIHLPLNGSDVLPMPPRKNISRKHALLAYNFLKQRFEFKVTGKNGAFVDEEFVENGSTWIVPDEGMRIQIGGIGFKIVIPTAGRFETGEVFEEHVGAPPWRGKGGMGLAFTDEHGNEVRADFDSDEEDEEDVAQMDEDDGEVDSDGMEGSDEEGSDDEEEDDEPEDEEAEQGDAENDGESSSELSSSSSSSSSSSPSPSSDGEEEAPPPEPVKMEKKRGRGRPRKDGSALSRAEAEKAHAKELAWQKEDRKKEKAEIARRAKEADRERIAERKRLEREERQRQKDKQAREKERERMEKEQRKEQQQKKLHLPQSKGETQKKTSKLYLPTPAAKKKNGEKSLTLGAVKKGPGRPPKVQPQSGIQKREQSPTMTANGSQAISTTESASPPPPMPEPEQAFSSSNPLMAVAAFNATAPTIDPQLYNSTPSYTPPITIHPHTTTHQSSPTSPRQKQKELKTRKEKPQPKKRTPSPELNEADYPPEALLKPAASYVILIHEAITNSGQPALTLPQIYKAIERKYPYFKLRVTTTGWQSSVRHNLGAHKAFNKISRSGKGWLWGINEGVSIEKEKNKASIAAQRPAAYQQQQQQKAGTPYPNGVNGHYQQPRANGQYQQAPIYTPDSTQPQRPQYTQPAAVPPPTFTQPQPQQSARMPPMPMAYQPPAQAAHTNGNTPTPHQAAAAAPVQQFPNAPIPLPSKLTASPEVVASIEVLKKQLALLTSTSAIRDAAGMDPKLVSQAQSVIQGLMSGRLKGVGLEVVKQLIRLLDSRVTALKQEKAATPTPAPPAPPAARVQTTPPAATQKPPQKVDFKNLSAEKKQALYRALMLAKEKKEKEAREAAAGSQGGGVKRSLENGGEPPAKKVDVGEEG